LIYFWLLKNYISTRRAYFLFILPLSKAIDQSCVCTRQSESNQMQQVYLRLSLANDTIIYFVKYLVAFFEITSVLLLKKIQTSLLIESHFLINGMQMKMAQQYLRINNLLGMLLSIDVCFDLTRGSTSCNTKVYLILIRFRCPDNDDCELYLGKSWEKIKTA